MFVFGLFVKNSKGSLKDDDDDDDDDDEDDEDIDSEIEEDDLEERAFSHDVNDDGK